MRESQPRWLRGAHSTHGSVWFGGPVPLRARGAGRGESRLDAHRRGYRIGGVSLAMHRCERDPEGVSDGPERRGAGVARIPS